MNSHEDFRNVIREERENLTRLSDYWNNQIKCNQIVSKDDQGRIRAAVGKTRLLLAEKFKQFEGLIEQSENNTAEKEISINDLQGFWDLVLIQSTIKNIRGFQMRIPLSQETDLTSTHIEDETKQKISFSNQVMTGFPNGQFKSIYIINWRSFARDKEQI